jgi:hypothetical protein
LRISGDVALAIYADFPLSGIGVGYGVSLTDGTPRYVTTPGPIYSCEPLGAGAFLVGYMGYGAFETVLIDGHGQERNRWNSHGHYVIWGDDVRVIEMGNTNTLHRLARLMPDGTVIRGDLVAIGLQSAPYVQADGTIYFASHGSMIEAHDLMIVGSSAIGGPRDDVFHTRVVGGPKVLFATYSANRLGKAGSMSDSNGHVSGLVRITI